MKKTFTSFLLFLVLIYHGVLTRAQTQPVYRSPSAPVEQRVDDLLSRMTLEDKIDMLGGYNDYYIRPNERLGIPLIKMSDGPLGVRNYGDATAFPAAIAFAASWNSELMRDFGGAVGKEARSKGVHIILAPGLNIYRAPMCGRNFEYLGEDPYLAGQMAASYVKGVQSEGVVATLKHFALNNQEYDRHNISSDVDERALQEIYMPAFKAGVQAGAGAVMASYNLVNGVHATQNHHLLADILKDQWKFDGFVMSDWGATYDGIAAANAGLDLEMPSGRNMNRATLLPAIREGKVQEAIIDDKVRRILRVLFRFGFFDRPQEDSSLPLYSPDSRLVALKGAREGIVLLKNKGNVLPLDRAKIKSVLVIGPEAHPAVTGGGGSSRVRPFRAVSVLEGLTEVAGNRVKIYYAKGIEEDPTSLFTSSVFSSGKNGERGLQGEYFASPALEGSPSFTRTDPVINFRWTTSPAPDFPKTNFSVRWTGWIHAEKASLYDFVIRASGAFRLLMDDRPILSRPWHGEELETEATRIHLGENTDHSIRLEYFPSGSTAAISFGWGEIDRRVDLRAVALAHTVDAAVVCVGFNPETEGEGADRSFALPEEQEQLINDVAKANSRTIVVLTAGGNVAMTNWIDHAAALLHTWYPGQEGGTAVAEILFGDVNPSGKLPVSFEKRWEDSASYNSYYPKDNEKRVAYSEGIFVGYRHFDKSGIEPRFPFGYGLSYTSFEYKNLRLSSRGIHLGEKLRVSFEITNTGRRAGAEAAQLYLGELHPSEPRPVKELKGFAKVFLEPGETKPVELEIDEGALSFFSARKNAWIAEPDEFEVLIGSSSKDIRLRQTFAVEK